MSNSYIHTKRKSGITRRILHVLAVLYFVMLAAGIVYLWCFTKDRFITTALFKISKQDSSAAGASLAELGLPGLSDSGSGDTMMAINYINSADLLLEVEKEFNLVEHYTSVVPDYIFRMSPGSNLEERLKYYRKRITARSETGAGMTAISVDTFDATLSQKIAARLLEKSENYVNIVNQAIADRQSVFVHEESERAARNLEDANNELATLQNTHGFIHPEEAISGALKAIQEMKMDIYHAQADLSSLLRDNPDSPRIEIIRSHIRSVNELIDRESAKLTGPEKDRLGQILIQCKQLEVKLDMLARLRSGAELALEKNRVDAIARSRFFTVLQKPYRPEDVAIPRRGYTTVTILALGAILFLMLRALTRSIFENA